MASSEYKAPPFLWWLVVCCAFQLGATEGFHGNLFYILRKHLTAEKRKSVLLLLCNMFTIIGIDADKLKSALLNTEFNDFEDCLQVESAKYFEADFIITRNLKDFTDSIIPALEPLELIKKLSE